MKEIVVSKFGGSSVKNAESMLRCCKIIESKNIEISQLIVISATQFTTNQLEIFAEFAKLNDREKLKEIGNEIFKKHTDLASDLFSSKETHVLLQNLFEELLSIGEIISAEKTVRKNVMAKLYGIGERISSLIFTDLLKLRMPNRKIIYFDVTKVLKTDSNYLKAKPNLHQIEEFSNKLLMPLIKEDYLIVTQGFIAKDNFDDWTILGREGSDYTATLLGSALNAKFVEIWTDVPGVASIDPRLSKNAFFYSELSYNDSTDLAINGAKVLFPDTLLPTKTKSIPVFVGSSINPELGGTWISEEKNKKVIFFGITSLKINESIFITCFIPANHDEFKKIIMNNFENKGLKFVENTKNAIKFKLTNFEMEKEILVFGNDLLLKFFRV